MQVVPWIRANEFDVPIDSESGQLAAAPLNSAHHQTVVGHFNGSSNVRHAIGERGALNGAIKERERSTQFNWCGNR